MEMTITLIQKKKKRKKRKDEKMKRKERSCSGSFIWPTCQGYESELMSCYIYLPTTMNNTEADTKLRFMMCHNSITYNPIIEKRPPQKKKGKPKTPSSQTSQPNAPSPLNIPTRKKSLPLSTPPQNTPPQTSQTPSSASPSPPYSTYAPHVETAASALLSRNVERTRAHIQGLGFARRRYRMSRTLRVPSYFWGMGCGAFLFGSGRCGGPF